jgi:prepilin-type N-terminal cleavage/methylation domain-containing protein
MDKRRAFTLVEVLVIVAILGLLTAIVIPRFIKPKETIVIRVETSLNEEMEYYDVGTLKLTEDPYGYFKETRETLLLKFDNMEWISIEGHRLYENPKMINHAKILALKKGVIGKEALPLFEKESTVGNRTTITFSSTE